MTMRPRTAASAVVTGVVLLVVAVAALYTSVVDRSAVAASSAPSSAPADLLTDAIETAERRVADVPGEHATWAALGGMYVEQARLTADPSYYAKADDALAESLRLRPDGNDLALTASGVLANARHDFRLAAELAGRALRINEFSATTWAVLADARTQLGDSAGATEAVERMLALRPGVASFTRASYDAELRGDTAAAVSALEQALEVATTPADEAFARTYLGELALSSGDLAEAERQFSLGLELLPDDPMLLMGRAHVAAVRAQFERAARSYRQAISVRPLPEHLVEYGEFLLLVGEDDAARTEFARAREAIERFAAHGVDVDLDIALLEADHGDPTAAVAAARAEFDRRQNAEAHDALAWALHSAGQDGEALEHARAATALQGDPRFLYHRAVIEAALGRDDEARSSVSAALEAGPYFSPLYAARATELLESLGGAR
jgi:tetratricopeptide (TPR) repeat protein